MEHDEHKKTANNNKLNRELISVFGCCFLVFENNTSGNYATTDNENWSAAKIPENK